MAKARKEAAWKAAFIEALARSGSVTAAAGAAGVDRTTAYLARGVDEGFAGRWRAALAEGRGRLAAGEVPTLARDEIVRTSRHGRPCVMRVGPGRWSAEKEALFLAVLEETANLKAAADAVGLSTTAIYARREKQPGFADAWAKALATGYTDVELLLIRNAKAVLGDAPKPRRRGRLKDDMTVADALNLLKLHRGSVKGGRPQRYGWRKVEPPIEEVRESIMRKIEAIERAEARGAG